MWSKRLLLLLLVFINHPCFAQCPSGKTLWDAVEVSRNDEKKSIHQLLDEMLKLNRLALTCNAASDSGLVSLHQRLAALYFNMDSVQTALHFINMALDDYNRNPRAQSVVLKTRLFFTQAMIYKSVPDYVHARKAFDSLINEAETHPRGDAGYMPLAYKNMANISYQSGDYERSLLEAERSIISAMRIKDNAFECLGRIEKSMALYGLDRFNDALQEINKAADLSKPAGIGNDELGNLYSVKASIERKLNLPQQAMEEYRKCQSLFSSVGFTPGMLLSINNIGDIYLNDLHDPVNALNHFSMALKQAISSYDSLRIYTNIADAYSFKGDYQRALKYYQLGLQAIFKMLPADPAFNPQISELSYSANLEYLFTTITNKSICWSKLISSQKPASAMALQGFLLADKIVDALSWENFMTGSKIVWRSKAHELYEQAIALCFQAKNTDGAFYFFEKSRAVVLNEKLNEVRIISADTSGMIGRLAMIRKKMNALKSEAVKPLTVSYSAERQLEYVDLNQQYEAMVQKLRSRYPYVFNTFLDTTAVTLPAIQSALRKQQKELIEVFLGGGYGYLMYISPSGASVHRFSRQLYDSTVAAFIALCSNEQLLNSDFAAFSRQSTTLYSMLFQNIQPKTRRLVVSPDGGFFPYEALKRTANSNVLDFLVNDFAISYTYAARSLLRTDPKVENNARFFGIAPVQFNPAFRLPQLDASDRSIENISYGMGGKKLFTGSEATRRQFQENYYKYQCIQLYTHAAGSSDRNEPVIYFADSAMYLSDLIPEHQVSTKLVFLSACETGLGNISKGEGVFSFNRGFAELGIPATISTLWPINNRSTYAITESFYKFLSQGMEKDIALQQAKLEFIQNSEGAGKLPFAWAAPVLIGDTSVLMFENDYKKTIMVLVSVIVLIAAVVLYILQKRKQLKQGV
ncbi:MAG TPA: CHAT domain-containing tetratricopeptide repeat protein [Flavitalea sp.]|nr:CHAT domain-containing tetratricopeptide repeat protein [Flavitalea sp.]